ncbi:No apical meristem-associated, C-terminal domain [Phytophthora cactorum]|nr:No apical meristem-associated, C-terminal domain [Phytophthora cactorum]
MARAEGSIVLEIYWESFNPATKPKKQEDARSATALLVGYLTRRDKSVGCHSVVKARNESGKGEADILNDTRTLYTEQQGSSFIFEGCWLILRSCPKFMEEMSCQRGSSRTSSVDAAAPEDRERPVGRKRSKAELADDKEDTRILKQLVVDNKDRNTALLTQMKRKNDLIEELLTLDLFKMDPDSEESKPFFTFIRTKRLAAMMQNRAIEVSSSRRNERDISNVDNAEDDATGGARSLGKPSTCVTNGEMTTENEGLEALDVSHTLL